MELEKSLLSLLEKEQRCIRNYNRACDDISYFEKAKEEAKMAREIAGLDPQGEVEIYNRMKQEAVCKANDNYALLTEVRKEIKEYFRKIIKEGESK